MNKMMNKPTLSSWKSINWKKASTELKGLQAKLYGALKADKVDLSEIKKNPSK